MLSEQDRDTILSYLFEGGDSSRIELAVDVLAAGKDIAIRVVRDFLAKVERALAAGFALDAEEWIIQFSAGLYPFNRCDSLIEVGRPTWRNLFGVRLEPQGYDGKDVILGVRSNRRELERIVLPDTLTATLASISTALGSRFERSKSSDDWPIYWFVEPKKPWRVPEALAELIGDRGERRAVAIAADMIELGRAFDAEPAIGAIVRQWEAGH